MRLILISVLLAAAASASASSLDSTVRLTVTPPHHGTVSSEYFSCDESGRDCSALVPTGSIKTLTAYPSRGYIFGQWSGECAGETSNECTLQFDTDVQVQVTFPVAGAGPTPQPMPPPAPEPGPLPAPAPEPTPPAPAPTQPPSPQPAPPSPQPAPPPTSSNLMLNPGFESGNLDAWSSWSHNGTVQVSTVYPHSGTYAAYVYSAGGAFQHSLRQRIYVPSGGYRASCYIRGSAQSLMFVARDFDAHNRDQKIQVIVPPSDQYRLYSIDYINVTAGSVTIAMWVDGNGSDWGQVDDCVLTAL